MKIINEKSALRGQVKESVYCIIGFVAIMWAVELINMILDHRLSTWGIFPRTIRGLWGILFSPFLHASIFHILLNTVPFVILGGLVILRGLRLFLELSLLITLLGGSALWLFGRSSYHVGASGLIFGYFGFIVARGWFNRSLGSLFIAFITLFLYGGILWGLLPTFTYISWEGHLFGLLAGILGARLDDNGQE